MNELVSIIITTYYRNEPLRIALMSAINQYYRPIEIIVVDDSGEQHAKSVVDEYEDIKYITHDDNKGQIAAWETGFNNSNGKFIQFQDDDDFLRKDKISSQIKKMKNGKCGVIYSGLINIDGTAYHPQESIRGQVLEHALRHEMTPCQTTSMLIKKSSLSPIFPLKRYNKSTDIALQIELACVTDFDFVDDLLVIRHIGGDAGTTRSQWESRIQIVHDYGELYNEYNGKLKQNVLARSYLMLANKILDENIWSIEAITALLKSIYHNPTVNPKFYILFVLFIFGKPGRSICSKFSKL